MIFNANLIVVLTALVVLVNAQGTFTAPSSGPPTVDPGDYSPCVIQCVTQADGCPDLTDLQCICTNTAFLMSVTKCITDNCPQSDLDSAKATQKALCSAVTGTASGTAAPSTSGTATGTTTGLVTGTAIASTTGTTAAPVVSTTTRPASTISSSSATSTAGISNPATSSSAAGSKVQFDYAGLLVATVALVGAFVGAGFIL